MSPPATDHFVLRRQLEQVAAIIARTGVSLAAVVIAGIGGYLGWKWLGRRRYLPDIHSRNPAARNAAERTAVNTPIQGTAADLIKRAMLLVDSALTGHKAKMLLQVHDELVLEAPEEEVASVGPMLVAQMKKAADLAVPLEVDLGEGNTWAEAH